MDRMTQVTAQLTHFRMSPQKVRLVTRTVRGKSVTEALTLLQFDVRAAAAPLRKLIASAVANAQHRHQLNADALTVADVVVSGGPVLKRWMPRAQGRATHIAKRTSTVRVTLVAHDAVAPTKKERAAAPKKRTRRATPAKKAAKKVVTRKAK